MNVILMLICTVLYLNDYWLAAGWSPDVLGVWIHCADGSFFAGNIYFVILFPHNHRSEFRRSLSAISPPLKPSTIENGPVMSRLGNMVRR